MSFDTVFTFFHKGVGMNRFIITSILTLCSAGILCLHAQRSQNGDTTMQNGGNDSSANCGMMMMHFMKPGAAFPTQDGGFIIIMGNKIMKYDKDLNLKKETEMKMDTTAMRKAMQQMRQCPMMKGQPNMGNDTTGHGGHH
jgi:hypothetical protein